MVQRLSCLDPKVETRCYTNDMKGYSGKHVPQKCISSNIYVEPTKLKGKKNQCVKLQPLNAKIDHNAVLTPVERKFSHRLNPLPDKPVALQQKKLTSKIPVLQKKNIQCPKQKNEDIHYDTTLSAADRRQKFHQSRLHAAGVYTHNVVPLQKIKPNAVQCDMLPWHEGYVIHKVAAHPILAVHQKNVLPPIKVFDVSVHPLQKASQPKNKCLLGEITHFPALCNPVYSKNKKSSSTIPHLPPIMPLPPAPPPSISTSLEKDGNQVNEKDHNAKSSEELKISKSAFHKIIPA